MEDQYAEVGAGVQMLKCASAQLCKRSIVQTLKCTIGEMRKCANVHLEAAGLQRRSLLGDIWQPKRLLASLANRKQDF